MALLDKIKDKISSNNDKKVSQRLDGTNATLRNEDINPDITVNKIREYQRNGWDLEKLYYKSEYIERKQYERREFSDIELNQFKKSKQMNASSSMVNSSNFHDKVEKHSSYKDEIKEKNKSDLRMKQIIQERETISNRPLTLKERNKLLDELASNKTAENRKQDILKILRNQELNPLQTTDNKPGFNKQVPENINQQQLQPQPEQQLSRREIKKQQKLQEQHPEMQQQVAAPVQYNENATTDLNKPNVEQYIEQQKKDEIAQFGSKKPKLELVPEVDERGLIVEPVKTYVRLADQESSDIITHANEIKVISNSKPSYDPNAKYAIEMIDIYKTFGQVHANNGITFRVKENEVHALIGENGAGKSVLMSILFGIYNPDSGKILINGEPAVFSSPMDATFAGLGMVHQHFKLVETDSIYENVVLGVENVDGLGVMKNREAKKKLNALIEKYNLNLDINKKVSKLNVAEQQKTEILKLLYREASIMIFDEPTAVLSDSEIKQFLEIIKQLKAEGKTIILITHKFNEIKKVADRGTVIRLGTFISDFNIKDKNTNEMVAEMVGDSINFVTNEYKGQFDQTKPILEVKDVHIDHKTKGNGISFDVHAGEIFAIAGVTGNGQSELSLILSGLEKPHGGKILLNGKHISSKTLKNYKNGLSFVPEDRHKHAVILDMPCYMNAVLNRVDFKPYNKNGILDYSFIKEDSRQFFKDYDVRGTTRGSTPIRQLSGGNQQKLVVGRELDKAHNLIILVQPTRGLDLLAINNIHKQILKEKEQGNAILLISYELDEILSLADTIAVMNKNQIVGMDTASKMTRDKIGKLMVGGYEH